MSRRCIADMHLLAVVIYHVEFDEVYIQGILPEQHGICIYICTTTHYMCSAQSRNLRNLEITLCILRIPKLRANLEIAHWVYTMSRLRGTSAPSRDRAASVRNLEIAQFLLCAQLNPSSFHCIYKGKRHT